MGDVAAIAARESPSAESDSPIAEPVRTSRTRTLATIAFGLVALACIVGALVARWGDVQRDVGRLSWPHVALATVLIICSLFASMMAWRTVLADLGTPLPVRHSARVVFTGQLGKYIPGSLWAVVAQAQLARKLDVSTGRATTAAAVHNLLSLGVSLVIGAAALPFLLDAELPRWVELLAVLSPAGLVALTPPVLNRILELIARVLRRPSLEARLTWRGMSSAVGWTFVGWVLLCAHVVVLGHELGGRGGTFAVAAIGGYALAWAIGFLAILAPAGAGARELVLLLALSTHLPDGESSALTLAVVSRLLTLLADVAVAVSVVFVRGAHRIDAAPGAP
jgi:uncharacterized membrane protein YbhN (UPF0104 family)